MFQLFLLNFEQHKKKAFVQRVENNIRERFLWILIRGKIGRSLFFGCVRVLILALFFLTRRMYCTVAVDPDTPLDIQSSVLQSPQPPHIHQQYIYRAAQLAVRVSETRRACITLCVCVCVCEGTLHCGLKRKRKCKWCKLGSVLSHLCFSQTLRLWLHERDKGEGQWHIGLTPYYLPADPADTVDTLQSDQAKQSERPYQASLYLFIWSPSSSSSLNMTHACIKISQPRQRKKRGGLGS